MGLWLLLREKWEPMESFKWKRNVISSLRVSYFGLRITRARVGRLRESWGGPGAGDGSPDWTVKCFEGVCYRMADGLVEGCEQRGDSRFLA